MYGLMCSASGDSLWTYGLFDCFHNVGLRCIKSFLCPCYQIGRNSEHLDQSCEVCCLLACCGLYPCTATFLRGMIRSNKNISGSFCQDCVVVTLCYGCALTQESEEVKDIKPLLSTHPRLSRD